MRLSCVRSLHDTSHSSLLWSRSVSVWADVWCQNQSFPAEYFIISEMANVIHLNHLWWLVSDYLQLNHNSCSFFFICGVGLLCFRGGDLICYLCCQISRFPITNWATLILAFWGQTFTRVLEKKRKKKKNFGKLLSCLCCVGLAPSSSSLEPQIFIQLALFEVHS